MRENKGVKDASECFGLSDQESQVTRTKVGGMCRALVWSTARSWISDRLRLKCLRGNQKEAPVWYATGLGDNLRLEIKT